MFPCFMMAFYCATCIEKEKPELKKNENNKKAANWRFGNLKKKQKWMVPKKERKAPFDCGSYRELWTKLLITDWAI